MKHKLFKEIGTIKYGHEEPIWLLKKPLEKTR